MAERRPLVMVSGEVKELPAGDTLPSSGGGGVVSSSADYMQEYVRLLLVADYGFADLARGSAVTNVGVQRSTAFRRFGFRTFLADNTYLYVDGDTSLDIGSAEYAFDIDVRLTSLTAGVIYDTRQAGGGGSSYMTISVTSSGEIVFTSPALTLTSAPLSTEVWYNVSVHRDSNDDTYLHIDGVEHASDSDATVFACASGRHVFGGSAVTLGTSHPSLRFDNARLTVGHTRYVDDFSPPLGPHDFTPTNTGSVTFNLSGDFTAPVTGTARRYFPRARKFSRATIGVATAPSATLTATIKKNGTSVGTITVASSQNYNAKAQAISVVAGDYLTVDVSGANSSDLVLTLE